MNPGGEYVTACIAAKAAIHKDPALVLCMDMMGSTESSSAETTWKMHRLCRGFNGLIAGPIATAREMAGYCGVRIDGKSTPAELLQGLRDGIGDYKQVFADSHVKSRLGISYLEFMSDGEFPDKDVRREICWEIKNHYSQVEIIVAGFCGKWPVILKVSGDSVCECDDFAVVGSGAPAAESSLFYRSQNMHSSIDLTVYQVYEAKRLAEGSPGVGKTTKEVIFFPCGDYRYVLQSGFRELDNHFASFGPQRITLKALSENVLTARLQQSD